jgi:hypothetical protein
MGEKGQYVYYDGRFNYGTVIELLENVRTEFD